MLLKLYSRGQDDYKRGFVSGAVGYDITTMRAMLVTNDFGIAKPFFCQYICPSGTLLGGIPLLAANPSLRQAIGLLFSWKMFILLSVLALSVFLYRPFCKYLCPLGAVYALFNKVSFVRMAVDEHKCVGCGRCARACQMQVPVPQQPNHSECIRCGACKKVCPTKAMSCGIQCGKNDRQKNPPAQGTDAPAQS